MIQKCFCYEKKDDLYCFKRRTLEKVIRKQWKDWAKNLKKGYVYTAGENKSKIKELEKQLRELE